MIIRIFTINYGAVLFIMWPLHSLAIKSFRGGVERHQLKVIVFRSQVPQNLFARVEWDFLCKDCFLVHFIRK